MQISSIGDVDHDDVLEIALFEFVYFLEIDTYFMIFTSSEKAAPICHMMLFLSFQIAILLKHTHQSLEPKIGFLRFIIRGILIAAIVELVLIILDRWWWLLLIIVDILIGVGLSFSLIANLVVDVGIFSCYFLVVYQKGYFTFSVA